MKKYIYVDKEGKERLREAFKCTGVMVWKALSFNSDSQLARNIRFTALKEMGGVANWEAPLMETYHDENLDAMVQTFGPRVRLIADKMTGKVEVLVDGAVARRHDCVGVPALMTLQGEVLKLAMSL